MYVKNCNTICNMFIFMKQKHELNVHIFFYKQVTTFSRSGNSIENYKSSCITMSKLCLSYMYVNRIFFDVLTDGFSAT